MPTYNDVIFQFKTNQYLTEFYLQWMLWIKVTVFETFSLSYIIGNDFSVSVFFFLKSSDPEKFQKFQYWEINQWIALY